VARADVFTGSLRAGADEIARCAALLAPAELDRAARFRFAEDRRRFIVRRARLREVLAEAAGGHPARLSFTAGAHGKPALAGSALQFSASHSGERWLVATSTSEVGADLERIVPSPDWPDLAASLFAPAERSALAALCPDDGQRAFFDCWARKEAFVKALGLGLSYPLDAFAVAVGPQPELLAGGAGWTLAALSLGPDFAGAVVMADDGQGLSLHLHAGTELSCEARQAIDPPAMCAYHSAS
jgi:4'-phosphopantetheinyl transferase